MELSANGTRLWMSDRNIYDISADAMTAVSSFAMNDTHDYYSPIFYMDPEKNKLYCSYAAAIDVISTQSMRKTGSIFIGGLNGLSQDFVISPSGNIPTL